MDFKGTIRQLRSEKGLTQERAARKIGVALITYARWENGTAKPALRNLYKLKRLYGIGLEELREVLLNQDEAEREGEVQKAPASEPREEPSDPEV